jgi:hypothetical protein
MTNAPETLDLAALTNVTGGRLFGGQGGWLRPAGVGGGLFGLRAQRLAGGCPGGNCGGGQASPAAGG